MTSKRQIAANRENAAKSTGPKTSRGKSRASRNAVRHGLASAKIRIPIDQVKHLAKALCKGASDPFLYEQALIIAECHILLARIRAARIAAIERKRDLVNSIQRPPGPLGFWSHEGGLSILDHLQRGDLRKGIAELKQASHALAAATKTALEGGKSPSVPQAASEASRLAEAPDEVDASASGFDEVERLSRSLPELLSLERYERRTVSRRNRAIRRFDALAEEWVYFSNIQHETAAPPLEPVTGAAQLKPKRERFWTPPRVQDPRASG